MKRIPSAELLDTDAGTPEDVARSLADLRRVNRWFGGIATTQALLERVASQGKRQEFSLLDVAGACGDVPLTVRERLQRKGLLLHVTVMDRAHTHMQHSRNGLRRVAGSAIALPFSDNSFDLVSSSLFVHHLAPEQARQAIEEWLRVCRVAVVINDLRRSWTHLALVYAGFPLYSGRFTRNDAPASVRQAYTMPELHDLACQAGASRIDMFRHYLYRMGVIAWK